MTKQKFLNKLFGLFVAVFMTFSVVTTVSVADAQSNFLCAAFPCNGILGPNGSIDLVSIVTLVFRIILYAALLWTVWNIVLAGLKIAGAKEDADKRKEGIQAVINAVIGLVVALLAFGIVLTVTNTLNAGNVANITGIPCTGIRPGSTPPVAAAGFRDSANQCVLTENVGGVNVVTTLQPIPTP
jgi:hypothetical protein